ncbi:hypothetical protein [Microbacterium murale]|uniref:Pyrrolo-quinoline quinone n=1 Tax=Microbacterium murale TaxID=1081040 RepID=A0ABQ1RWN4_9MICO|nr:hypothetical protein [Microbacterium murale]GGD85423.1 hypothetical protein GCM10007269_30410 [Microbacterium murale]
MLAYVVGSEGAVEIVAWDADDGQELWRRTALPGTTPRGVAQVVAAGHDRDETALITTPTGLSAYRLSR